MVNASIAKTQNHTSTFKTSYVYHVAQEDITQVMKKDAYQA